MANHSITVMEHDKNILSGAIKSVFNYDVIVVFTLVMVLVTIIGVRILQLIVPIYWIWNKLIKSTIIK